MNNCRGISYIEAMIVADVVGGVILVIFDQVTTWSDWGTRADRLQILEQVMKSNVTEVKIRNIDSVPAGGTCLTRRYDLKGNFRSESSAAMAGTLCPVPSASNQIVVIWRVPRYASLNVTFNPAPALSLPRYKEALKEVEVVGRRRRYGPGHISADQARGPVPGGRADDQSVSHPHHTHGARGNVAGGGRKN